MNGKVRAYDGAVDGVEVFHGLLVDRRGRTHAASETTADAYPTPPGSTPHTAARVDAIMQRATEVIGTRAEAMRWLGTPVRALNFATPISLLVDEDGCEQVAAVLTRLEHGVL